MAGRRNPIDSALLVAMVLVLAALAWGTWRDESFWQTPDQRAYDDYLAQDYSSAEARFQNLQWKASACYRRGDFSCAAEYFAISDTGDTADAAYNLGNALSRSGKTGSLTAALASYQTALKQRPGWPLAIHNQRVVADLLSIQSSRKKSDDESESGEPNDDAEGTVVDDRAKHGKRGEVSIEKLAPNAVDQLWLRNVKTDPAAFLRLRFAAELAANRPAPN